VLLHADRTAEFFAVFNNAFLKVLLAALGADEFFYHRVMGLIVYE
jgi:hypothetical protein